MIFLSPFEEAADPLVELPIVCGLPATQSLFPAFGPQSSALADAAGVDSKRSVNASPAPCRSCGREIYDRTFLLIGSDCYHEQCVKCAACHEPLDELQTCFFKDDQLWCRRDFVFKYGKRCQQCNGIITCGEYFLNIRQYTYHADCFVCFICNRVFQVGDQYVFSEDGVVYCDDDKEDAGLSGNRKTKRMRTSFKHHQLKTMKTYFNLNHNPDAKDLKQLAQKTGLTKRVLQVWFQNARAKFRRSQHGKESTPVYSANEPHVTQLCRVSTSPTSIDCRSLRSSSPDQNSDDSGTRTTASEYM